METFKLNLKRALVCLVLLYSVAEGAFHHVFDVKHFGAQPDGKTDCTKAFLDAWVELCQAEGTPVLLISRGEYLVGQSVFKGPCKGPVTVQVDGTLKATTDTTKYVDAEWLTFEKITGLTVIGAGTFDGQGSAVWGKHDCNEVSAKCGMERAVNFKFRDVTNGRVEGITSLNPKGFHLCINTCTNFNVYNVKIIAPGDSPNTDGIHISHSINVAVTKSRISTGDDCVSIIQGDTNVTVSDVFCGPGHGISVGSLGKYKNEQDVHGIFVRNCTLSNSENGVRIKTWRGSPPSIADDIHFEDIIMDNVKNPIIVDQEYCGDGKNCRDNRPSQVKLTNVSFKNIRGTSSTKIAVKVKCSQVTPCANIAMQDIDLNHKSPTNQIVPAESECANVKVAIIGKQNPRPCI